MMINLEKHVDASCNSFPHGGDYIRVKTVMRIAGGVSDMYRR